MNEFQILDQVVPDSTSLQQRSIFQVIKLSFFFLHPIIHIVVCTMYVGDP